jgi:hypothetical protein
MRSILDLRKSTLIAQIPGLELLVFCCACLVKDRIVSETATKVGRQSIENGVIRWYMKD